MNELRIGWASRNISTDKPVDIPGQFHTRVSQGVIDPITVTALVIDNGSDLVVFLSADLVSIPPISSRRSARRSRIWCPASPSRRS